MDILFRCPFYLHLRVEKAAPHIPMSALPLELWLGVIDYLPPISLVVPSILFNYTLRDNHTRLWHTIFRSDEFGSSLATEQGIKLILFGNDLQQLYDKFDISRQSGTFLALGCYNRDRGSTHDVQSLHKYKSIFRASLQKHVFCSHGVVKLIDSNITLFVAENVYPIEPAYSCIAPSLWTVPGPARLISQQNGTIESAHLCWDSASFYKYVKLRDGDIIDSQERNCSVNYSNIYLLRLLTTTIVVFLYLSSPI